MQCRIVGDGDAATAAVTRLDSRGTCGQLQNTW